MPLKESGKSDDFVYRHSSRLHLPRAAFLALGLVLCQPTRDCRRYTLHALALVFEQARVPRRQHAIVYAEEAASLAASAAEQLDALVAAAVARQARLAAVLDDAHGARELGLAVRVLNDFEVALLADFETVEAAVADGAIVVIGNSRGG